MRRLTVRVHDARQARAALEAAREFGLEVRLASAPRAAAYAGVGLLAALGRELAHPVIADCGDDAGLVLAGLRTGLEDMLFTGEPVLLAKLRDMAEQVGARVRERLDEPVLALEPQDDAAAVRRRMRASGTMPRPPG